MENSFYKFPKNFLWGASSSAFQVEGGWNKDGKGMTVADYNSFLKSDFQADTKVASDFYYNFEYDINLMKDLGLQIYRFSISWARIIPDGDGEINRNGINFYRKIIELLIKNNIIPFVTLYHFDLPFALVKKYNGWESRDCINAFIRYAQVCFNEFGDIVKYWQVHNEQNLMTRIDERINLYQNINLAAREKIRAQMDYHMCLAHALAVKKCHETVKDGKIGPAVSSSVTYPLTCKPEDVFAAKMNDNFKLYSMLDMHYYGKYPDYYLNFLEKTNKMPNIKPEDKDILTQGKLDFIAVNYYRTNCASFLPSDKTHVYGTREGDVDYNIYGLFQIHQNPYLEKTQYSVSIDPTGLRIALNEYWKRYHLPIIITENGYGSEDILKDNKIHDNYRIDYISKHIKACEQSIKDGVNLFGYCHWSFTDLLSSSQGFKKRYGLVYINRCEHDLKDMKRYKKDSYYWYKELIKSQTGNSK